ncbi:ferrous iron transport protein A [Streptococcaceae bacterium ESL0687]|nr:ferrous iron transport protein A [Streptococcaceae bacterium ESL0687]
MKTLDNCIVGQTYYIDHLKTSSQEKQLQNLGLVKDKQIMLSKIEGENAIVLLQNHRLALDKKILSQIVVSDSLNKDYELATLDELEPGMQGIVERVDSIGELRRRLMDMGITRGVKIYVRKVAPLGDPIEVHLRGYALSLRKAEAHLVRVKVLDEASEVK